MTNKPQSQDKNFGAYVEEGIGCLFMAIALVIIMLAGSGQLITVVKIIFQ